MKYRFYFSLVVAVGMLVSFSLPVQAASLESRVNEAFRSVYKKNPSSKENVYWLGRVVRREKRTFEALRGAMFYHRARGKTIGSSSTGLSTGSSKAGSGSGNKQQMIKDVLPLFVKIWGSDPTKAEKAWWRKRISCNEIRTRKALINSMNYHKSKGARQGRDTICGAKGASSTTASGVIRRAVAGISSHPMGDQVRIAIYKTDGRAIHVTANGKYQIREGASKILGTLGKDDVVQVSWSDGKYHVRGSGVSFDTVNKIRLVPLNQAVTQIKSYSDPSATYPGKNYNRFRGGDRNKEG